MADEPPAAGLPPAPRRSWEDGLAWVLAALVVLGAAHTAMALVRYPWDWDPGEADFFDAARRALHAPELLYPLGRAVPMPQTYGPVLLPLLMPIVAATDHPFGPGRLVMVLWATAMVAAAYRLLRERASRPWAFLFAAAVLLPLPRTFWYFSVRIDGPMLTLLLWSAVSVLPRRIERGADALDGRRVRWGTLWLTSAGVAKVSALVLGAPMVLAWWAVDRASFRRLAAWTALGSVLAHGGLALATRGGYPWTIALQRHSEAIAGQTSRLVEEWLRVGWPAVLLWLVAALVAGRRRGALRDGGSVLVTWALVVVPMLPKVGAAFNYFLPAMAALPIASGRLLGPLLAGPAAVPRRIAAAATVGLLGVLLAFPGAVPDDEDRRTGQAFYDFIGARGAPLLAAHPSFAYFRVGQFLELEPTLFPYYLRAGLPGTREVLERVRAGAYRTIVANPRTWRFGLPGYVPVGACVLDLYYGYEKFGLFVPARDAATAAFEPAAGTRCERVPAPAAR